MPLYSLANMTTVLVRGKYRDLVSGQPARGKVRFTPSGYLASDDGGTLLVPTSFDVRLDARGWVEIDLPIVNDPDYGPLFHYLVEERLRPARLARPVFTIAPDGSENPFDLIHSISL